MSISHGLFICIPHVLLILHLINDESAQSFCLFNVFSLDDFISGGYVWRLDILLFFEQLVLKSNEMVNLM